MNKIVGIILAVLLTQSIVLGAPSNVVPSNNLVDSILVPEESSTPLEASPISDSSVKPSEPSPTPSEPSPTFSSTPAPTEPSPASTTSSSPTTPEESNSEETSEQVNLAPAQAVITAIYQKAMVNALQTKVTELQRTISAGENPIPAAVDLLKITLLSAPTQDSIRKAAQQVMNVITPEVRKIVPHIFEAPSSTTETENIQQI